MIKRIIIALTLALAVFAGAIFAYAEDVRVKNIS